MGAKIEGIGSNMLHIEGVKEMGGCYHRLLPDMIEIGSFIGLAAMTGSEITIKDVSWENLGIIPNVFRRLGIQLERRGDDIFIPAQENYEIDTFIDGSILTIADAPWPGFTPDLLSIVLVVATQAKGSVLIHQKMFESRLFFVDKLIAMGARISGAGTPTIAIHGVAELHGADYAVIPDRIEAGTFLLAAAITRSRLRVAPVIPEHLGAVLTKLEEAGCRLQIDGDGLPVGRDEQMLIRQHHLALEIAVARVHRPRPQQARAAAVGARSPRRPFPRLEITPWQRRGQRLGCP